MTKKVHFHIKHLDVMEVKPEFKESVLGLDKVRYVLSTIEGNISSDAITIIEDGRILLAMGYFTILPGVVEVWLLPSIYVEDTPVLFVKEVKNYLEALAQTLKWDRIQTVTQDNPQHRKWMELLGFCEEGIMKKYFLGKDYIMSARCFDEVSQ